MTNTNTTTEYVTLEAIGFTLSVSAINKEGIAVSGVLTLPRTLQEYSFAIGFYEYGDGSQEAFYTFIDVITGTEIKVNQTIDNTWYIDGYRDESEAPGPFEAMARVYGWLDGKEGVLHGETD